MSKILLTKFKFKNGNLGYKDKNDNIQWIKNWTCWWNIGKDIITDMSEKIVFPIVKLKNGYEIIL